MLDCYLAVSWKEMEYDYSRSPGLIGYQFSAPYFICVCTWRPQPWEVEMLVMLRSTRTKIVCGDSRYFLKDFCLNADKAGSLILLDRYLPGFLEEFSVLSEG